MLARALDAPWFPVCLIVAAVVYWEQEGSMGALGPYELDTIVVGDCLGALKEMPAGSWS